MRASRSLALLAAASLALSACGGSDDSGDGGDNDLGLINAGTLTVCSDVPYPPFEDVGDDGEYTGFDMDLMREIATGMDLEFEVKDIGFEGLQSGSALAAGTCDIGASAMTITDERKENLNFSEPYYDSLQSLLVPEDSDVESIEDLDGMTVGVQQGTTGQDYAEANVPDGAKVTAYPSDAELFPALQSGGVDAVLQDLPVNILHTDEGAFTIVEEYETNEQYGFAVKKEGAEALLDAVNEQLSTLREDGTYDTIYENYFSED